MRPALTGQSSGPRRDRESQELARFDGGDRSEERDAALEHRERDGEQRDLRQHHGRVCEEKFVEQDDGNTDECETQYGLQDVAHERGVLHLLEGLGRVDEHLPRPHDGGHHRRQPKHRRERGCVEDPDRHCVRRHEQSDCQDRQAGTGEQQRHVDRAPQPFLIADALVIGSLAHHDPICSELADDREKLADRHRDHPQSEGLLAERSRDQDGERERPRIARRRRSTRARRSREPCGRHGGARRQRTIPEGMPSRVPELGELRLACSAHRCPDLGRPRL